MILFNLDNNFYPYEVDSTSWTGPQSVKKTQCGPTLVSTSFLGLPHHGGMFETMLFGGPFDAWMTRCKTYDQAIDIHDDVVRQLNDLNWFENHLTGNIAEKKPLVFKHLQDA